MKYLCLVYLDENRLAELPDEDCVEFDASIRKSGHCIASEALQSVHTATTVRVRDGRMSITDGPFADFGMNADQWHEFHIGSWLHDCGKVTTPEYVVDKATKLETIYNRVHEIRMRFEVLRRDAVIAYLQGLLDGGDDKALAAERDARFAQLEDDFAFIAECNIGGEFLDDLPEVAIPRLHVVGDNRQRHAVTLRHPGRNGHPESHDRPQHQQGAEQIEPDNPPAQQQGRQQQQH